MKSRLFYLLFTFISSWTLGQSPKLYVLKDSVKIGETFQVSLSYSHKPQNELFFPDSAYLYSGIEYIEHNAFPTKTDSISLDSAVYTFANFSIEDSLEIKLPIFILSRNDSIKIESNSEYIFTKRILEQLPDSLALKTQLAYITIEPPINYNLIITIIAISLLFLIVLLVVFRKKIKNWIINYLLKRKCEKIIKELTEIIARNEFSARSLNRFLGLSKKTLEVIYKIPVTTFTTSQIRSHLKGDFDANLFLELDKHIYSSSQKENTKETLLKMMSNIEKSLEQKLK